MTDPSTVDTEQEVEAVQPDVTYQLTAFAFGLGQARFSLPDTEGLTTEPVVLLDAVLVDEHDHSLNARIVLAGATSAIVAEEADEAAHGLLRFILDAAEAAAEGDDPTPTNDTPDGENGEAA